MRRECGEFLWPWLGAPISKVFVVELTRKRSFLLGTQLLVSQHEQALLDLIVSRPLALLFLNTVFLRAQEDANVQVEKERTCNHIRKNTAIFGKHKMETLLHFSSVYSSSGVIVEVCLCIYNA